MSAEPVVRANPSLRWVVVQFSTLPQNQSLPYIDGLEQFIVQHGLAPWSDLFGQFPGITIQRLFRTVPPQQIAQLEAKAHHLVGGFEPDRLRRYFRIQVPAGRDPEELAQELKQWAIVNLAYVESPPTKPPANPNESDPPFRTATAGTTTNLGHLADAGIGVNVNGARGAAGGRGEEALFADIEQGWGLDGTNTWANHPDLDPGAAGSALATRITFDPAPGWGGRNELAHDHGTKVLGVVRGLENPIATPPPRPANEHNALGVAPQANGILVSEWRPDTTLNRPDSIVSAVKMALDKRAVGAVLLLESQIQMTGPTDLWAVELEPAIRDAIRLAAALGLVVIEPSGDGADIVGGQAGKGDMDAHHPEMRPGDPDFVDSGAIVVAAGASAIAPGAGAPRHGPVGAGVNIQTRYGNRVDCYAWGENVGTTSLGFNQAADYTDTFDGTSSAAAIIAGVALVVQGMVTAQRGFALSPGRMRLLLRNPAFGTDSTAGSKIGVMPDLGKLATALTTLGPEIYIRDNIADTGVPHTGPLSSSPDIIVKRAPVANPQQTYGEGSGTENDDALGDEIVAGQDYYLYVRVRNRGSEASGPTNVDLYWAEPSTLLMPDDWTHIPMAVPGASVTSPSMTLPDVPPGDALTVSPHVKWPSNEIPGQGHYCFVALVDCARDPAPHPVAFESWDRYVRFVRDNNNVAWRNFNVIELMMLSASSKAYSSRELKFFVRGPQDRDVRMRLEAIVELPPDVAVELLVPPRVAELLRLPHRDPRVKGVKIPLEKRGLLTLGEGMFPAGLRERCELLLSGSGKPPTRGGVIIRQMFKDIEVGRITWRVKGAR